MSADLMPFDYEGQTVRSIVIDGEPWFVAADVARILGYRMASDMTRRLDDDDRGTRSVRTPSGDQDMTVISEPGLYAAIFGSRVEGAERFKRWLGRDVLPQIRKTGSYAAQPMTREELLSRAVLEATAAIAEKDEQIAELAPKAELADTYLSSDGGDRLVGQAAKMLGLREKDLRRFLIEDHLIFVRHSKCGTVQYEPYAEFAPHFAVHETVVSHTWGNCSHFTIRVKPRGLDLIRRRLAKAGLVSIGAAS